jgi:transcriptional regulator with XRE-family HTH domain
MTIIDDHNADTLNPAEILSITLKEIGIRIVELRKSQNISQQKLSELAKLDRAYLSAVENGKQNITLAALIKISCALGVPFNQLIF